jgi:hypothetical protein
MEEMKPGPCEGDPKKAVPVAYASLGVRWDKIERFRIRFSDGRIEERHNHISEHAPYWHFGYSDKLTQPPRFDTKLRATALTSEQPK